MASRMNNALPVPAGQGAKYKSFWKSTWDNYPRLGAHIKRAIVRLAMRGLIPAGPAGWLINRLELRAA